MNRWYYPRVKVLLVSPDPRSRELMRIVVRGIERRTGDPIRFIEATNGDDGVRVARRERPDAIVADEIASRAGAMSLARTLRDDAQPYDGVIVILLARRQDDWLAEWSGADGWFVKPVDPFRLTDRLVELVDRRTAKETA
jgi:DNA-binding response OmpR family regulator